MCTGFQVSSTRSRDFAEQIQGSARWGLRPDLLRPSPKRATFQAPPSVAEERGGFRGGGHLSPPRIFTVHMMRELHLLGVPAKSQTSLGLFLSPTSPSPVSTLIP